MHPKCVMQQSRSDSKLTDKLTDKWLGPAKSISTKTNPLLFTPHKTEKVKSDRNCNTWWWYRHEISRRLLSSPREYATGNPAVLWFQHSTTSDPKCRTMRRLRGVVCCDSAEQGCWEYFYFILLYFYWRRGWSMMKSK